MQKNKLNNKTAFTGLNILIILLLQSCKPVTTTKTSKTTSTTTNSSTSTSNSNNNTVTNPNSNSGTVVTKGQTVADLDSNNYMSWLVKSVCVDTVGNIIAVDPYGGCPAGNTIRKIKAGDPLPYNNIEQFLSQGNDSYILLDSKGNDVPLHTYDNAPYNEFNQHTGSDGYDVYYISATHVSVSSTKDAGGYSSTFFGSGCTVGNGWVFYPLVKPTATAEIFAPIAGTYWEHAGLSYPGPCPKSYSKTSLTSWSLQNNFVFGGKNGNSEKTMDTLISVHGYQDSTNFTQQGHLEVFYFTKEYGLTRWEVWDPIEQGVAPASTAECNGETSKTYKNKKFIVYWCHDWSVVRTLKTEKIPLWPIPVANLLSYFHFEGGMDAGNGMGLWHRFGKSPAGNMTNWDYGVSGASSDSTFGANFRFFKMNCGAGSDGQCSPGQQAIYQDVDFSAFTPGKTYFYGVNARTETGTGSFSVGIQVVNTQGAVIWQDLTPATVKADNGDGHTGEPESIYMSVAFINKTFVMPTTLTNAKFVRYIILPTTAHTFYFADAWLNRFPALGAMLKVP